MPDLRTMADEFLEKYGREYTDLYRFSEEHLSDSDPTANMLVLSDLCKVWCEAGEVIHLQRIASLEREVVEAKRLMGVENA